MPLIAGRDAAGDAKDAKPAEGKADASNEVTGKEADDVKLDPEKAWTAHRTSEGQASPAGATSWPQ